MFYTEEREERKRRKNSDKKKKPREKEIPIGNSKKEIKRVQDRRLASAIAHSHLDNRRESRKKKRGRELERKNMHWGGSVHV